MTLPTGPGVVPVGEARAGLTATLREFRRDPEHAPPVVLGSHRAREAVLLPYAQYAALTSSADAAQTAGPQESSRELLHRHRTLILRLAQANRIGDVQVFGSVARGDDAPDSDVDLLVDPEPEASLFDLAQFEIDLEALLGRPVDVVSRRGLDDRRDRGILQEATPL
ncbi:nucleotidyltransferase family protein [Agromyces sp. MMS24-JH15]|uniref:nucleotidyltransferase family protein n=1 Tax=Agromyces sp. MMS24-JH15 TaxID=3243765 RepID=UPI00374940FE